MNTPREGVPLTLAECCDVMIDALHAVAQISGTPTAEQQAEATRLAARAVLVGERLRWLRFVASDEFLRSPEWRRVRMDVLVRDGAVCACCGGRANARRAINVDHIQSRLAAPHRGLDPSNLQVLCDDCNAGKGNRYDTDWRLSRRAVRRPEDFALRLLLLESGWWEQLDAGDHDLLRALPGWHGEAIRLLDQAVAEHGAVPWAVLRERVAGEAWGREAMAAVEGAHLGIQAARADLSMAIEQLRRLPPEGATKVLGWR